LTAVSLDRYLADAEFEGDLFVQEAADHPGHDFLFSATERRVMVLQGLQVCLKTQCGFAALKGQSDRVQQHGLIEWFRQEFDSSRLHGLDRHGHVAMTRDENYRDVRSI